MAAVTADKRKNSGTLFRISEDREFGSVRLGVTAGAFAALGFRCGDSVDVLFESGHSLKDVPYFNGYYVRTGDPVVVCYMDAKEVLVAYGFGDALWRKAGCREGGMALLRMNTPGKYLAGQNAMDLWYSEDAADFPSHEAFSNFRSFSGGRMAKGRFYRGASPVNDVNGRAAVTDGLIERYGIRFVLDIADTPQKFAACLAHTGASFYTAALDRSGAVVKLGLTAAYRQEKFCRALAQGLAEMMRHRGPCYIQCTEGKDRTGFVCLLLEALCGATAAELERDYMETYAAYYGITQSTDPEKYAVIKALRFDDMLYWLAGTPEGAAPSPEQLVAGARRYLKNGGMTDAAADALTAFLSRGA